MDRSHRLLELFRAEARESLAQIAAGALQLERGEGGPELVGALFRSAHTVKGGARMLGLDPVTEAAEKIEAALAVQRSSPDAPPSELGGVLLRLADELRDAICPQEARADAAGAAVETGGAGVPTTEAATTAPRPSVRVRPERIDALVGLVAEARRAAVGLASDGAGQADPQAARVVAELLTAAEGAALRLRLVPMGAMFDDLRRAIRDAALADGKEAELVAVGGEVEADAAVVDAAAEIVLQLVRNAVAHGLETPAERAAAGKPTTGRVEVGLRAVGSWVELRIADDGRGVDEAAVRRRATTLGAAGNDVAELLFLPGLSTRERADQLGGQGVGLDVVRARARAAGGEATVSWEPGRGTTFVVRLPVTALYERLVVGRVGGALVGVPVDAVVEIAAADGGGGLALDDEPDEVSVLTVPLGPLFAPSKLARRGWIAPDGSVGVVLDPEALQGG